MTTTTDRRSTLVTRHRLTRPWGRWVLTALALPPAGLLAHTLAGPVDAVPSALLGGLIAGAGIGAGQWLALRSRGVPATWIAATAGGLAVGLTAGAAAVSYRTDVTSLVVMGAASGLAVGAGQAVVLGGSARRAAGWTVLTAALWALGWAVTTAAGVDVAEQWTNYGAAGVLTVALVQSCFVRTFVTDRAAS